MVFAKGPHQTRYWTSYGPTARNLVIAAHDDNAGAVRKDSIVGHAATLRSSPLPPPNRNSRGVTITAPG